MRDAIAWSYALLAPEEQQLLRRLSVFAGGFTLDAAEAIGQTEDGGQRMEDGTSALPSPDFRPPSPLSSSFVLDLVASLADKSLLFQSEATASEPRFLLLETVREFALEELAASGEAEAMQARHAAWCLAMAEEIRPYLFTGSAEIPYLARLDAELDNIRAAIAWLSATKRHGEILRLNAALAAYLAIRPMQAEVMRWLDESLHTEDDVAVEVRALAFAFSVFMTYDLDAGQAVSAYAEEALALAPEIDDPRVLGEIHYCAALAWHYAGDDARARRDLEASLALMRQAEQPIWIATILAELSDFLLLAGDVTGAIPLIDEAMVIHRTLGASWSFAQTLGERAHAAVMQNDPILAASLYAEGIAVAEEIGDLRSLLGLVACMASVALALGQPQHGVRLLGAAAAAREVSGIHRSVNAPLIERITNEARGALPEPAFRAAWANGESLSFAEATEDALNFAATVQQPETPPPGANPFNLTQREIDVLRLLVEGRSDREIADALFIGVRTAQTHVGNLFAKLGVNARAEAAAVAVRQGIV
jgi:non-specific serine/threonine protein kinase